MRKPILGGAGTMESSKVTSKTSSLKALLLRAWRERWTDLQWGIHIKTILPRGVSGDVYNLADCILQQALVGPGPNQLVLSYLKHSLSSQLVSYAAVLQRISKYDGFHKPHCVNSLLEFLENIQSGITCRGKPEEGVLAGAVLSLTHWLLQCYHHALTTTNPTPEMLDKPPAILNDLLACHFITAMLYLARHDDKELYSDVVKKCQDVEVALTQSSAVTPPTVPVQESIKKLCCLESTAGVMANVDACEPLTYCLQALLAIQVVKNPSSDPTLVNQLRMLQRLKGYSNARLYCELIRASLMGLNDVLGASEETQWSAFTFLKVPHILRHLEEEYSSDVVDGLELLLQFSPLLDILDAKSLCNCLECLLVELEHLNLITEDEVKHYTSIRETANPHKMEPPAGGAQTRTAPIPKVIIQAEPTLVRILKTLDADYAKIQDPLLSVLCQVLTGKSFELILAVATVQGKLSTFVSKLIKFNECSKQAAASDTSKATHVRAMLFDVTFLMLCSIVQTYGSQVIVGDGDSFFEEWVRDCMVEHGKPKSPDVMLQRCDAARVDTLLAQFNSADHDFKTSQLKWHEVCTNIPSAIREVLLAWEQEALSPTDVKRILDAMRSRMCCLPICAVAWLCSYMQIQHQDALLKPMNLVQQFLTSLTNEDMAQQDNFKERSGLMSQIIRKMQYDVHPPTLSKTKVMTLSHSIISKQPISEQLEEVWAGTQQRGWLNIESTHSLESLLNTGGAQWFVNNVVKEMLKLRFNEDLERCVDLVLGVLHLDILNCTLALIYHVLPQYLHNKHQGEELVEPQSTALAKLSAYCVFAAWQAQAPPPSDSKSRKRQRSESDLSQDMVPATKLLRLEGATVSAGGGGASGCSSGGPIREPLLSALTSLFKALSLIAERSGHVSVQTHFVFRFLQLIVSCGHEQARPLLALLPNTLVGSLVRSLPDLFTTDLVLRLYDLSTPAGRKATARDLCLLRNMSIKPTV